MIKLLLWFGYHPSLFFSVLRGLKLKPFKLGNDEVFIDNVFGCSTLFFVRSLRVFLLFS
jgi:hypothetical protein